MKRVARMVVLAVVSGALIASCAAEEAGPERPATGDGAADRTESVSSTADADRAPAALPAAAPAAATAVDRAPTSTPIAAADAVPTLVAVPTVTFASLTPGARAPAGEPGVAILERLYRFGAEGSLPLSASERPQAPAAPGAVLARWYTFQGWYVAVLEGLDQAASPLCVGTAIFNRAAVEVQRVSNAPTAEGGCADGGAGVVFLAVPPSGLRRCGETVAFVTAIPGDVEGTLFATVTRYVGDGTAVGLSGSVEVTFGALPELAAGMVDCAALPAARALVAPPPAEAAVVITPAPPSAGVVAAAERTPPPPPPAPQSCEPAVDGVLQDVRGTAGAPYFVHQPAPESVDPPTVVFLPGGNGGRGSAERAWETYFGSGAGTEGFRVVIVYSDDAPLIDDARRTYTVVREVLGCYGGDPSLVHLAGVSNGGLAAFALMAEHPEYFATLLGAPGAFPIQDPTKLDPAVVLQVLGGRAVFNGVGVGDGDWKPEVIATHNVLAAAGVESVYVEFPNQGHIATAAFDPRVLVEFWVTHSVRLRPE